MFTARLKIDIVDIATTLVRQATTVAVPTRQNGDLGLGSTSLTVCQDQRRLWTTRRSTIPFLLTTR